jgi:hypothetical protein
MVEIRTENANEFSQKYKIGKVLRVGANEGSVRECVNIQSGNVWMVETIRKDVVQAAEVKRFEVDF